MKESSTTQAKHEPYLSRMKQDANSYLESLITSETEAADRRRAPAAEASKLFTEAVLRQHMEDPAFRDASLRHERANRVETMRSRRQFAPASRIDSPSAKALTLQPFSKTRDVSKLGVRDFPFNFVASEDTHLQIFGAPYQDQFTSGAGHADRFAGTFGFGVFAAGGSSDGSAAVWVQFTPSAGISLVQVRAYTPYNYQWFDSSSNGYVAHNSGGFGVLVLSFDNQGGDRRTEQDFRYRAWDDGTGWFEEHSNPAWSNGGFWDNDNAYLWGNEAPHFAVDPNRIYLAAIWCFGHCDADSGFWGSAISQGNIEATAGFVVIGEQ